MTKNKSLSILLVFLIFFTAFSRLYKLADLPYRLHADEIMNAYVGKFILKNGVDINGNSWPFLYFNNFNDYPNVIPMYLSGLSTFVFGNNAFAVRLPIALMGITTVYLIYLIIMEIFKDKLVAVLSAFSLSIMPWHILMSRSTAEGITASATLLLAVYLLIKLLKTEKRKYLILSIPLLLLTYFLYPGFRILTPLALFPLIFLTKNKKLKSIFIFQFFFFLLLTLLISQTQWGKGRFDQTSVSSNNSKIYVFQQNFIAGEGNSNALKARFFYNKAIMFSREFLDQYFSYFSGTFLFSQGSKPLRYYIPEQGVIYYSFPLLIITVFFFNFFSLNQKKSASVINKIFPNNESKKFYYYLIYLLLISPIPAALTIEDTPNLHRALFLAPCISLAISYFIAKYFNLKFKYKKIVSLSLLLFLCLEVLYFSNKFVVHMPSAQASRRDEGRQALAEYIFEASQKYDKVFVPVYGAQPLYYLFFNNNFDKSLSNQFNFNLDISHIGNIFFLNNNCPKAQNFEYFHNSVFIRESDCLESETTNLEKINTIYSYKNIPAFYVYAISSSN